MPESEPTTRQALGSFCARCLDLLALIPVGLFVLSQLGRYFFVAEIINNFRCQLMFLMILFAILLLIMRKRARALFVAIFAVWSMVGVVSIYLPADQPPAGSQRIKFMSFNVWISNGQGEMVCNRIREIDPDVLAILEYDSGWQRKLKSLANEYPYSILEPRWHGYGLAVFSRYPLSNTRLQQLTAVETDVPLLITDVNAGESTITIYVAHVFSPTSRQRLEMRNRQLKEIAEHVNAAKGPKIVLGDFNSAPWSVFLTDFLRETGLRDSRQEFGNQATWHSATPLLRVPIDHAFVSKEPHVHGRFVGRSAGSDHLPIVLDISVAH